MVPSEAIFSSSCWLRHCGFTCVGFACLCSCCVADYSCLHAM